LKKREDLITSLKNIVEEAERKQRIREADIEKQLIDMTKRHANQTQKLKARLVDIEDENKHLTEDQKKLQEHLEAINEERDRLHLTTSNQDDEIKRLNNDGTVDIQL
jgi:septal ring factor EnvC (AmiA/AmiB activator)